MPRPTHRELAEIIVFGLFITSMMINPYPLRALLMLFADAETAATIVSVALRVLVALWIVSSAKVLADSRARRA